MKKKFFCLSHAGKSIQPTVEKTIILVFKHRLTVEKMIACSVGKLLVSNNLPSHQVLKKKLSPAHSEIASFRSPQPPYPRNFSCPLWGVHPGCQRFFLLLLFAAKIERRGRYRHDRLHGYFLELHIFIARLLPSLGHWNDLILTSRFKKLASQQKQQQQLY